MDHYIICSCVCCEEKVPADSYEAREFGTCVRCVDHETKGKVRVLFNPFAFSDKQNQEFLKKGYEVMPMEVPKERRT